MAKSEFRAPRMSDVSLTGAESSEVQQYLLANRVGGPSFLSTIWNGEGPVRVVGFTKTGGGYGGMWKPIGAGEKDPIPGDDFDYVNKLIANKFKGGAGTAEALEIEQYGSVRPQQPREILNDSQGRQILVYDDGSEYVGTGQPFGDDGKPVSGLIKKAFKADKVTDKKYLFSSTDASEEEIIDNTNTGPVEGKVVVKTTVNADGSTTYFYSDNTSSTSTDFGGSSEGATAFDVFKNTLSLFFGAPEMNKPWVSEIYKSVSGYTKSGSSPEEAFNMAVLEARNNPALTDFTKRFKGIYALQKMKQEGKAVTVPTVAEYFATESKMGDILKSSNLGDLANEDFLGDVLGKGVSATEFANRITNIFDRIDIAPDVTKKTIARYFPTLDRTQLARALALGERGAKQLQQDLAGYEVLGAAEAQGLGVSSALPGGITNEQAQQIAKGGGTFASTLGQFGQIARARETEQKLAEISGVRSIGVAGLTDAVIGKSAKELKALEDLTMQEEARFAGKAGTAGSRALASQSRANRII